MLQGGSERGPLHSRPTQPSPLRRSFPGPSCLCLRLLPGPPLVSAFRFRAHSVSLARAGLLFAASLPSRDTKGESCSLPWLRITSVLSAAAFFLQLRHFTTGSSETTGSRLQPRTHFPEPPCEATVHCSNWNKTYSEQLSSPLRNFNNWSKELFYKFLRKYFKGVSIIWL